MANKKKIITLTLGCLLVFLLIATVIIFYPFFARLTPYYRTCSAVKAGTAQDQVFVIMKPYEKYLRLPGHLWQKTNETEYLYESPNGAKCRIFVKDNIVTDVGFEAD
jgi:flagellar basal body-associated protein FliL